MKSKYKVLGVFFLLYSPMYAQRVDYSVVYVPEEAGIEFTCITAQGDYVCMPLVERNKFGVNWFSNKILDISKDGQKMAYLSARNSSTNIFIKELGKQGGSIQRTNRLSVIDFNYSPDGTKICFSESRGKTNQIFLTDAENGYVCRQITSSSLDYSPVFSSDMSQIFFVRQESQGVSIWSHNVNNNFLSTYSTGMNPCPLSSDTYICVRPNSEKQTEIWKINYKTGIEECIVSVPGKSFTSPIISPDGKWLAFVGASKIELGEIVYWNTDIYVSQLDGTSLTQLTYHAADDLSPVWSKDGKYIYFISQRGTAEGIANIWRMNFNL